MGQHYKVIISMLCHKSLHMNVTGRELQLSINGIHRWSLLKGFKFSKTKTVCMRFCLLRNVHAELELTLDEVSTINVVAETITYGPHFRPKAALYATY